MTKRIPINGFTMAYTDTGRGGETLLFVHGLPTSKELFGPVIENLGDSFRCIAVDLVDYGESERTGRHVEHRERAAQLKIFLETLNLEDVIVVCHDLGVSVVMDLLPLATERIRRLVMMSPPVYPDFREPAVVKIVRSRLIGPVLIGLFRNILLRKSLEKGLHNRENYTRYQRAFLERAFAGRDGGKALLRNLRWGRPGRVFAAYPETISGIRQPVLVIQGLDDPYIPVEHARRLAGDIPDSELLLLGDAGHFLPIDVPDQMSRHIQTWISDKKT